MCRSQREGRQHRHFQARTVLFTQLGEHGCRRRARERTAPDVLWMLLSWRSDHKLAGSLQPSQTATQFGDIKVFREETRFIFFFIPLLAIMHSGTELVAGTRPTFWKTQGFDHFWSITGVFRRLQKKNTVCVSKYIKWEHRNDSSNNEFIFFFTLIRNAFRTQAYILIPG